MTWFPKEMQNQKFDWQEIEFNSINYVRGYNLTSQITSARNQFIYGEVKSVALNLRQGCVETVSKDELASFKKLFPNLYYYTLAYVKPFQGFAHAHIPLVKDEPNANVHVIISNTPINEERLTALYHKGGPEYHTEYGHMLGYPDCCIDFFCKHWRSTEKCCLTHFDLLWHMNDMEIIEEKPRTYGKKIIKATTGFPEANPFLRYAGIRLVPYMPCSMKCEKTKDFANKIMRQVLNPTIYDFLYQELQQPIKWDRYHGLVMVETPKYWTFNNTDYTDDQQVIYINGYTKHHKYNVFVEKAKQRVNVK